MMVLADVDHLHRPSSSLAAAGKSKNLDRNAKIQDGKHFLQPLMHHNLCSQWVSPRRCKVTTHDNNHNLCSSRDLP